MRGWGEGDGRHCDSLPTMTSKKMLTAIRVSVSKPYVSVELQLN